MFQRVFGVSSLQQKDEDDFRKLASAVYLQVSTISQALIFVTRARSWSFIERPGLLLVAAFAIAQLVSELSTDFSWFSNIHSLFSTQKSNSTYQTLCWCEDCHTDCCVCKLEFCCNWRDWLGMGRHCLALQHHLLFPTWFYQVLHPICSEWKSLGSCNWAKGMSEWFWLYTPFTDLLGGVSNLFPSVNFDHFW